MKRRHTEITDIQKLKDEIRSAEDHLVRLKKTLTTKMFEFQKVCTHDEFYAEDNGDCHKSGYYYVCTECQILFSSKPKNAIIIYPNA